MLPQLYLAAHCHKPNIFLLLPAPSLHVSLTPTPLYLRTLGSLQLERTEPDGQPTVIQRGGKPLVLLAWFVRRAGRGQEKATVARRFWPEVESSAARKSLRQALHTLRTLVGADAFRDDGDTIALRAGVVTLDLALAHDAMNTGAYERALELCTGRFLSRVESGFSDEILGWIATERVRLRNALLGLVRPIIEARVRTADFPGRWPSRGI